MASISVGLKPRWEVEFLLAHQKFSFGLHSKRISLRLHLHTGFLLFFALRIARARGTILRRPAPNELRLIGGLWYEVKLAPLPEPVYRPFRETRKLQLKPYDRKSPIIEIEIEVRRLVTPAVRDVATGAMIAAGPATDDEASWSSHRRGQPDRYYAIAKHVLSRRELRRHRLSNTPTEIG
jgi:hypothetical protein